PIARRDQWSDATDWTDVERLAMEFLDGQFIDGPNGWSHRYLEPGSDEELKARHALVLLLVSEAPLRDYIRQRLACLFTPAGRALRPLGRPAPVQNTWETRELVFKNRAPGNQPEHMRDFEIAKYVACKLADGIKLEAAIQESMARFGVKRPTAFRAWEAHGEPFVLRLYAEGRFRGNLPKKVRDFHASVNANPDRLKAIHHFREVIDATPDL